jgi:hypothetical protein
MYNVLKFQSPFERIKQYSSPEVSLYKAIITQIIIDYTDLTPGGSDIQREAYDWIFGNSEDFKVVCYAADMEPCFVQKLAHDARRMNKKLKERESV